MFQFSLINQVTKENYRTLSMQLKMLSRNFPLIFYFSFERQISSEKQDFRQQVQSCNIHIFILSRKKNIIIFLHLVIFLSFYLADMFFYLVFFFEFILVSVAQKMKRPKVFLPQRMGCQSRKREALLFQNSSLFDILLIAR